MTATASSATTQAEFGDAQRWKSHPVAAFLLRAFIAIAPLALAFVVAAYVGGRLHQGDSLGGFSVWIGSMLVVSLATVLLTDRLLERLLPLVALLKLSLAFPDENVPSRVRFALRTGTARQLERRLEAGEVRDGHREAVRTLLTLLTVLRDHDRLTRGHSERVRAFSSLIAANMDLSPRDRDLLNWGALIHDVGKLAVDPKILSKAGKPSRMEWEKLREHPGAAEPLIAPVREWLGPWADAATQHHERWDGRGYPAGLAGEEISLAGRIVAVADAFDVMTSARSYKPALPFDDALAELTRNAGTQFDPVVVRAFLAVPPRRLRLVMGAFGWIGNASFLGEAATVATTGGPAASAAGAALATGAVVITAATPSLGFLNPAEHDNPWADRGRPAAREVDSEAAPVEPSTTVVVTIPASGGEPLPEGLPGTETPGSEPPSTETPGSEAPSTTSSTIPPESTTTTTPPTVAGDDAFTITKTGNTELTVQRNDAAGWGSLVPSSLEIIEPPTLGTATRRGLTVSYQPNPGVVSGTDRFVYRVCDEAGGCDTATVTLTLAIDD